VSTSKSSSTERGAAAWEYWYFMAGLPANIDVNDKQGRVYKPATKGGVPGWNEGSDISVSRTLGQTAGRS
jgi:hypothetical protein